MRRILRHRLVIGGVALAFAAGGGAAYAASQSSSNPREAFVNDVAKRLHVSPQRLTSAIKAAEIDKLDAAVKAGRLTRAQADAIKHAIEAKGPPFVGPGPGPLLGPPGPGALPRAPGPFGGPLPFAGPLFFGDASPLAAAARYLGLSESQVFNDLRSGRSLAQIAKYRGKSVSGLDRAATAAIKSRLDRAVTAKRITKAQEQKLLAVVSSTLRDLINRTPSGFGFGRNMPPIPNARLVPPF